MSRRDVIVIGGGPTGATAALVLARRGFDVVVLEKGTHPRFHVGESLMPALLHLMEELGLVDELKQIPQVYKDGAEFSFGHELRKTAFRFEWGLPVGGTAAFNIERARFDAMIYRAAGAAGAELRDNACVRNILKLEDGDVAVATDDGVIEARYLIDASGTGTVVGRHLGTRRTLPHLRKVAFFGHFENVRRKPGVAQGYVCGVMCKEGWFFVIPVDERRTSVGLVMDADAAKQTGVPANQLLFWAIRRCPEMAFRCKDAIFPKQNGVTSDFSYTCKPYAGPGYFLTGDAATFVDPIFSTGVTLGMMSAKRAAESIERILRGGADPDRLRAGYCAEVRRTSELFFRLVYAYYDHSFRELFLNGYGPLETHRAIISILAGHAFPPHPSLLWRLRLLQGFILAQRFVPLVPRRQTFSILEGKMVEPDRRLQWGTFFPEDGGAPPTTFSRLPQLMRRAAAWIPRVKTRPTPHPRHDAVCY
jgi:flavin-dependent dehydrogenase